MQSFTAKRFTSSMKKNEKFMDDDTSIRKSFCPGQSAETIRRVRRREGHNNGTSESISKHQKKDGRSTMESKE